MSWDDRYDEFEEKPTRSAIKWTTRAWVVVCVGVVLALILGAGIWLLAVATSDVKGQGDAEIIKNEAYNRIRAQEGFWVRYEGIKTADKNLTLTAEQLKRDPDNQKLEVELMGQKMICNDLIGQYNAAAQKFRDAEFRDAQLPHQIDDTSASDVNCKEN